MDIKRILEDLIILQDKYQFTPRAMLTKNRSELIVPRLFADGNINYEDVAIREPLIEHVGHLPIIASFLFQYIDHKDQIDLGKVLIMLSVHDIGETVVGDTITYSKTNKQENEEVEVARKIIPKNLLKYFDEFEQLKTYEAKFAKSIDAIAPLIHEIGNPVHTKKRLEVFNFSIQKIVDRKRSLFEWDNVLTQLFDEAIKRLVNEIQHL